MTETWTPQGDAILEGTSNMLHDPGNHSAGVSWGFCAEVVAIPGNPQVVMRSCIGDRVRPGHEEELDRVIEEVNREMATDGHPVELKAPPFAYARDDDMVFLEARFCPDELTDDDPFRLSREFERTMINRIPDGLFEPHMEPLHVEDDDDCCCDACRDSDLKQS